MKMWQFKDFYTQFSLQIGCERPVRKVAYVVALLSALMQVSVSLGEENISFLTFGTSLTLRGGWQEELSASLSACLDRPVDVEVVAAAGENSDWGVTQTAAVAALHPDIVMIEFAINDARLWGGVGREQARANLATMIAAIRAGNPQVRIILPSMNPASGMRGWMRPFLADYYADVKAEAEAQHGQYVDLYSRWLELPPQVLAAGMPDGVHPEPDLAAQIIVPALVSTLGDERCKEAP